MLFVSSDFLIFFPTVVIMYYVLPPFLRWVLLLAASYFFYACWRPEYLALILITTGVDFLCALGMDRFEGPRRRQFLVISLSFNLGLLFFFKYINFALGSVYGLLGVAGYDYEPMVMDVVLPVGISFYTFQSLSYVVDVYRRDRPAERRPWIYALYVAFFPQLVAGPIERSTRLLPQFDEVHHFDYDRTASGLRLMMWGFFKKCVIADRLAPMVDAVYKSPLDHHGPALTAATIMFTFQIFCDFSGYTDIAIGAARVLGFDLMNNFQRPYHARNVADFWRRWHISLSTWFRDYLYIPLGGNRVTVPRWYFNLLFVFVVSGLWHGANWTFLAWGLLHGLYIVLSLITRGPREKAARVTGASALPLWIITPVQVAITFGLVAFAWIFFRADSISSALYIASHLGSGWSGLFAGSGLGVIPVEYRFDAFLAVIFLGLMEAVHLIQARAGIESWYLRLPAPLRWAGYYVMLIIIIFFGEFGQHEFIYFQF